jgi:predicted kinase
MHKRALIPDVYHMSTSDAIAILVSGLPGSGKTYFAKRFAPAIGAAYFSSDIMRKTLTPDHTYSPMEKATVYTALMERMDHSLRAAQTVVLDATFHKQDLRTDFSKAAVAANSKVLWIEVRANKSVVRDRLSQVREDSDADYKVYMKLRDQYEPIKEPHLVLHSDKTDIEEMVSMAIAWVAANR